VEPTSTPMMSFWGVVIDDPSGEQTGLTRQSSP
jgi:hypothetical protein